ncbi:hypothetical protein Bhyg_09133 [Pseudolycoriella hygida]|uniref:Uncharacterized protein n=1 Tax=Pseudolycoriella hygida TaxID=35572 RepID=A0A9Q0N5Z2_9DIPT|nr:hypothetical protein Bhyg_09133 [Pseudolycoriella hygida]
MDNIVQRKAKHVAAKIDDEWEKMYIDPDSDYGDSESELDPQ